MSMDISAASYAELFDIAKVAIERRPMLRGSDIPQIAREAALAAVAANGAGPRVDALATVVGAREIAACGFMTDGAGI